MMDLWRDPGNANQVPGESLESLHEVSGQSLVIFRNPGKSLDPLLTHPRTQTWMPRRLSEEEESIWVVDSEKIKYQELLITKWKIQLFI